VYNAANEVCVEAFLDGRIAFLDIVDTVERVMAQYRPAAPGDAGLDLDGVLAADVWARKCACDALTLSSGPAAPGKGTA
jgi:1-deoxy-D-xylulose-5-phosphate reductoisomerase